MTRPQAALRAAAVLAALSAPAAAGIPDPRPITCPVGGEQFTVTGTLSCTTFAPHHLSLAPNSSCDWITHLPQCPGNLLPVYKEFTADEIVILEQLVASPEYSAVAGAHSKWFLAHWIAGRLGEPDPELRFLLLLRGLWWDTERVAGDPEHIAAALAELDALLPGVTPDELPIYLGIGAYLAVLTDDFAAAEDWKARAEAAMSGIDNDFITRNLDVLGRCIATGDRAAPECAPRDAGLR